MTGRSPFDGDVVLVLAAKAIRTFCYGYLAVLLPLHLEALSFDAKQLGWAVTLTLLGSAAATLAVSGPARKRGPRGPLLALSAGIVAAGALLLAARHPWLVVAAGLLGNVAVGTGETGPFLTLEQVILSRRTGPERMTEAFGYYNLVGMLASALGALAVVKAGPTALFAGFLAGGLAQMALYAFLGSHPPAAPREATGILGRSGPLVRRICALFSLDAFAGGFLLRSLIVYWLHVRFHLGLGELGWISFAIQAVTALSCLLAAPLARRLGLVRTMVLSHFAANVLLLAVALAPGPGLAVALLLARAVLSEIDVPARQSFLMLAVEDSERESAASLANTSRSLAQCVSPAATGWVSVALSVSAPFVLGAGLKIVYDVLLYAAVQDAQASAPPPAVEVLARSA